MKSLSFLGLMLCTSVALAEPPAPREAETERAVSELVNKQLLAPLKKSESRRSRFSRAAPAPVQRRVRVLDELTLTDARGKQFVRFAIDERRSWNDKASWQKDSVVGCAYLSEREVFVQHGEGYVPAKSMLGADGKARADVCRAPPPNTAAVAGTAQAS